MGGYGVMANEESLDYSVHEAWNEATNVYLLVILVSFALLMYARKNKRKIMRIFSVPPTVGTIPEPKFYDSLQKVRLRQQLEMYSLALSFMKGTHVSGKRVAAHSSAAALRILPQMRRDSRLHPPLPFHHGVSKALCRTSRLTLPPYSHFYSRLLFVIAGRMGPQLGIRENRC
ncbi:hypothetical protein P4O66_003850 [Electrophorus voltai]|uniref:Small integral membrane protein 19 n=1 Tax=Electrophorus voltai TaxID=2609070 RepID=A0AAD8ZS75_9TELE|nr:hypothetical protein P4O66_003850 [Electrophorus voltai]